MYSLALHIGVLDWTFESADGEDKRSRTAVLGIPECVIIIYVHDLVMQIFCY
jgi:hypothetical protein